jgi:hypothetical protein
MSITQASVWRKKGEKQPELQGSNHMEYEKKKRDPRWSHMWVVPPPLRDTPFTPRRRGSTGAQEIGAWSSKQNPAQGPGGEGEPQDLNNRSHRWET